MTQIQEVTGSGEIVAVFNVSAANLVAVANITDEVEMWTYSITLANQAEISFTFMLVNNATTVEFLDESINLIPNTLKSTVYIGNWPFQTIANQLQIVTNVAAPQQESHCSRYSATSDASGNVRWFQFSVNGNAVVGKFLDTVLIDGSSRPLQVTTLQDNHIAFSISHFWSYAVLDPDYSVILDPDTNSCGGGSHVSRTTVIAVTVPIVVCAVLIVVVGLVWQFNVRRNTIKRLSNRSSAEMTTLKRNRKGTSSSYRPPSSAS